jgi:aryl-alcohol dehydrogenase-like predicted oxidoreductase
MQTRKVGRSGLEVSALGLGCMGMSEFYGPSGELEGIDTIHRSIELGVTFLDTADIYGMGRNEELVGRAIRDRRDRVVLATKFGVLRTPDGSFIGVKGSADYVRTCCEASLRRLGVDVIDLYYQHRVDPRPGKSANLQTSATPFVESIFTELCLMSTHSDSGLAAK